MSGGRGKDRVTFRLDAELNDHLDSFDNLNKSALLRSLVESYARCGDAVEVGLERRLADVESELERKRLQQAQIESDIDQLQREIGRLETRIEERRSGVPEEAESMAHDVEAGMMPEESALDPENPAVRNQSAKAGLPPEQFVEEVRNLL